MSGNWNDANTDLLRKCVTDGMSANEAAVTIGGVSKNMCIGKAARLGLTWRNARGGNLGSTPRIRKPRVRKPKEDRAIHDAPPMRRLDHDQGWQQAMQSGLEFDAAIPARQRKSIERLGETDCRFVVGDPQSFDWYYCGGKALDGKPYCAAHYLRCYQPVNRPRVMFVPVRGVVA